MSKIEHFNFPSPVLHLLDDSIAYAVPFYSQEPHDDLKSLVAERGWEGDDSGISLVGCGSEDDELTAVPGQWIVVSALDQVSVLSEDELLKTHPEIKAHLDAKFL